MQQEFAVAYLAFLVLSSVYRVRRLIKSYRRPVGCRSTVYAPATYTIVLAIYVSIALAAIMEYLILRSEQINLWVSLGGVMMYVAVVPLRARAIKILGENMSPEIEIKKDHQLVKKGPYGYLRHPLAFCVIIELAGFTLVSNSYYALLGVSAVFFPFILLRVYLEEQALIEKFGNEYLEYKKEVFALLPFRKK